MNPMGPMVYIDLFTNVISVSKTKRYKHPNQSNTLGETCITPPSKVFLLPNRCFVSPSFPNYISPQKKNFKNICKLGTVSTCFFRVIEIFAKKVVEGLPCTIMRSFTLPKAKSNISPKGSSPPKKEAEIWNFHLPNLKWANDSWNFRCLKKKNQSLRVMNPVMLNNSFSFTWKT